MKKIELAAVLAGHGFPRRLCDEAIRCRSRRPRQSEGQRRRSKQQGTQKQLDEAETKISAADEKATSADNRAGDALGRADAASKKSDQVRDQLRGELNDRIANLDDYKTAGDTTVLFKFNSSE